MSTTVEGREKEREEKKKNSCLWLSLIDISLAVAVHIPTAVPPVLSHNMP